MLDPGIASGDRPVLRWRRRRCGAGPIDAGQQAQPRLFQQLRLVARERDHRTTHQLLQQPGRPGRLGQQPLHGIGLRPQLRGAVTPLANQQRLVGCRRRRDEYP
jgi:hypothetical protein